MNPGVGLKNSQRAQRRKSNIGAEEQNLWWAAGYNIIAIPLAAGCFFLGRYRACAGGWCSVDVCQYRNRRDQRTVAAPAGPQSLNSVCATDLEDMETLKDQKVFLQTSAPATRQRSPGYLIEGHVAAAATRVLLDAAPLSIRGCVTDAPPSDSYDVIALDPGSSLRSCDSRAQQL
ncbi:hypothetical protein ACFSX5_15380 [Devosia albogilva]|uniref:Uncharacterized protein n=1 Tax=Devosia albogilva TaxID=429726 RepID=A0ABW5QNW5_9HYPH